MSHWKKNQEAEDAISLLCRTSSPLTASEMSLISPQKASTSARTISSRQQQSILESLLAKQSAQAEEIAATDKIIEVQKKKTHKRKPLLVRRVFRSDGDEGEQPIVLHQVEPLDLTTKRLRCIDSASQLAVSLKQQHPSILIEGQPKRAKLLPVSHHQTQPVENDSIQKLIKSVEESAAQAASIMASVSGSNGLLSPPTYAAGSGSASNSLPSAHFSIHKLPQQHSYFGQPIQMPNFNPSTSQQGDPSSLLVASLQKSADDAFNSIMDDNLLKQKDKKQNNQRSVIKQKLEETFKKNGFLVKTKQVSDANGDATFCKFRQLRKYTRYYLKSWHQHLPDEVNKLWKGFLPPKTAKPTTSQPKSN